MSGYEQYVRPTQPDPISAVIAGIDLDAAGPELRAEVLRLAGKSPTASRDPDLWARSPSPAQQLGLQTNGLQAAAQAAKARINATRPIANRLPATPAAGLSLDPRVLHAVREAVDHATTPVSSPPPYAFESPSRADRLERRNSELTRQNSQMREQLLEARRQLQEAEQRAEVHAAVQAAVASQPALALPAVEFQTPHDGAGWEERVRGLEEELLEARSWACDAEATIQVQHLPESPRILTPMMLQQLVAGWGGAVERSKTQMVKPQLVARADEEFLC